ncbi:MAG: polysaccharide deacetylase family protein [Labilithrix sp.]|nr:polysaccharide deacetylase family protein [Labilithrix sp.]
MPPARIVFFAATIGGIGVTARAIMTGPPPLSVSVALASGYMALLLAGVFVLRLRMFADAIIRGPRDARGVVLTFDDGPDPEHTREVLDLLDGHAAKATFFVIGHKAEKHPELVSEIVRRGHEVGVHGFSHDRFLSLRGTKHVRDDLNKAVRVLENITGKTPALFRPPIGHTNPTIARVADELDLTVVGWSVGARDGIARTKPEDVVSRVGRGLRDGAIVLLHDAAERGTHKPAGIGALPGIFEKLAAKNLVVAHLPDWLRDN